MGSADVLSYTVTDANDNKKDGQVVLELPKEPEVSQEEIPEASDIAQEDEQDNTADSQESEEPVDQ